MGDYQGTLADASLACIFRDLGWVVWREPAPAPRTSVQPAEGGTCRPPCPGPIAACLARSSGPSSPARETNRRQPSRALRQRRESVPEPSGRGVAAAQGNGRIGYGAPRNGSSRRHQAILAVARSHRLAPPARRRASGRERTADDTGQPPAARFLAAAHERTGTFGRWSLLASLHITIPGAQATAWGWSHIRRQDST